MRKGEGSSSWIFVGGLGVRGHMVPFRCGFHLPIANKYKIPTIAEAAGKVKFKRTKKKKGQEREKMALRLGMGMRHDLDVRGGRLILCLLEPKITGVRLSDTPTPFERVR